MISQELLMILAKKGRVELIRTLKSYPEKDFTVNELARTAKIPPMTTWRAVNDLKTAGFLKTRRVGNTMSVSLAADHDKLRILRLIPETDPHRSAAKAYSKRLGERAWLMECRLFGTIGRGEHTPGDEVDIAVVFDEKIADEEEAKETAIELAAEIKSETNVSIAPLLVSRKDMAKRSGLSAELRDKETIWSR